jgi:adenine/guanine phosphoribosyltransferase-like PRPP-binding protein
MCLAGFEARGLIFGAPLALALGCAFVPLRKPGKLPGEHVLMPTGASSARIYVCSTRT